MIKKKSDIEKTKQLLKVYKPVFKLEWQLKEILTIKNFAEGIKQIQKDEDFLNEQFFNLFTLNVQRFSNYINDIYAQK